MTVSPGGKEALEWMTATPVKPPLPGTCCHSWAFQGLSIAQLPPLWTVAVQCVVPSGLQEMVTPVIDGHTLQGAGVIVMVGVRVGVEVVVLVRAGVTVCVLVVVGVFVRV